MTRPPSAAVSSSHRLSVYDFSEEDEKAGKFSVKMVSRFRNPKRKRESLKCDLLSSPVDKYTFLQHFTGCAKVQEKEKVNEPIIIDDEPIDVDASQTVEGMKAQNEEISDESVDVNTKNLRQNDDVCISAPICLLNEEGSVTEECQFYVPVLSSSSKCENKSMDMNSKDDCRMDLGSLSVAIPILEENEVSSTNSDPDCCSAGHEIDSLGDKVVISTDFFLYKDIYSTDVRVTFSTSSISVESLTLNGSKGTFSAEWEIGDIMSIESEWWAGVETIMVSLYLKPKVSTGDGHTIGATGNEKLKFSVYDPCWSRRQEAIISLDVRYKDIWKVVYKSDLGEDGNDCTSFNIKTIPKHSRFLIDETFDEVVYPRGDPDAVAISKRDVELLQPERFINDTIIDFYVKYLKNKIRSEDSSRFHFFNSFFFRKLADLDRNPSGACEGKAAFQRVSKWTRKVNLFEKDFLFIPVNYSLHWSLIVICHPGEIVSFRDKNKDNKKDQSDEVRVPCILHMDSIRGSHRGLKNLFQSYLYEEWKERHSEILDDVSSKFSSLRFISLELPQQGNSFDCGLFLLHYLELFLEEVPSNFNPFKITRSSNFLSRNWFLPEEASLKRGRILKLMCEILEEHNQKDSCLESTDRSPHSKYVVDEDAREPEVVIIEEKRSPIVCEENSFDLITELGIGNSVPLESCPEPVHQQLKKPGLDDSDFLNQRTRARPLAFEDYTRVGSGRVSFMSPIEEAEEPGDRNLDPSPDSQASCQILGAELEFPTFGTRDHTHIEEIDDDSSSSGSEMMSSEIGLDGDDDSEDDSEGFVYPAESDEEDSIRTCIIQDSEEDLTACVVEDSEEASGARNKTGCSLSDVEFDTMNMILGKDKAEIVDENLVLDSDVRVETNGKADVS